MKDMYRKKWTTRRIVIISFSSGFLCGVMSTIFYRAISVILGG